MPKMATKPPTSSGDLTILFRFWLPDIEIVTMGWPDSINEFHCRQLNPLAINTKLHKLCIRSTERRYCIVTGWWLGHPSEKYESQLGWLFPIYGKIKNVPNHQPGKIWWRDIRGQPCSLNKTAVTNHQKRLCGLQSPATANCPNQSYKVVPPSYVEVREVISSVN